MTAFDINAARKRLAALTGRGNEQLGSFDAAALGIGRYVPGSSPWERHNNGDELLLVVDGEVDLEVLDGDRADTTTLREGTLFVVPKGRWHQLTARRPVNILYASPSDDGVERTRERPVHTADPTF
jgi:mannose-6-phosphate isomerase-like protein (cupin superfamily)